MVFFGGGRTQTFQNRSTLVNTEVPDPPRFHNQTAIPSAHMHGPKRAELDDVPLKVREAAE